MCFAPVSLLLGQPNTTVKAADVAWASPERMTELGEQACFPRAPEICVKVLSPSNSEAEIQEKMALYFDADAQEVWLCDRTGTMSFCTPPTQMSPASRLCPEFPRQVHLR